MTGIFNPYGKLWKFFPQNRGTTQTVQELPLSSKIDQIVFGNSHILVLSRQDDAVWSKGENGHGQLGHGTRRAENQFRRIVSLSRKPLNIT